MVARNVLRLDQFFAFPPSEEERKEALEYIIIEAVRRMRFQSLIQSLKDRIQEHGSEVKGVRMSPETSMLISRAIPVEEWRFIGGFEVTLLASGP